jgi:hypothetical protein
VEGAERDLDRLLKTLNPKLYLEQYKFAEEGPEGASDCFALIREEEGATIVRQDPSGEWARISLGVNSSLEAVGLTAILASRLAGAGISANVIAGLRHDHIFVPWARREEALDLLRQG